MAESSAAWGFAPIWGEPAAGSTCEDAPAALGAERMKGTEETEANQTASDGDGRCRNRGPKALAILLMSVATVVQVVWVAAIAWGLYEAVDWLSDHQATGKEAAARIASPQGLAPTRE